MTLKFHPLNLLVSALAFPLLISAASAATDVRNAPGKGPVAAPQSPPAVAQPGASAINPAPGLVVTPTKMTSITVSATNLMVGSTLNVKLNGIGDAKYAGCGSRIKIEQVGVAEQWNGYPGVAQTMEDFSKWPKTQAFIFKAPGQYLVRLFVYDGAPASCGYAGPGSVPGDLKKITVVDATAK